MARSRTQVDEVSCWTIGTEASVEEDTVSTSLLPSARYTGFRGWWDVRASRLDVWHSGTGIVLLMWCLYADHILIPFPICVDDVGTEMHGLVFCRIVVWSKREWMGCPFRAVSMYHTKTVSRISTVQKLRRTPAGREDIRGS